MLHPNEAVLIYTDPDLVGHVMRGSNLMPTNRDDTKIVVMTDGLLIAMMIADITIPDAALLIIDEVHK
jgi:HrpA-like RNA helicase